MTDSLTGSTTPAETPSAGGAGRSGSKAAVVTPAKRLVNAPRYLVTAILAIWVVCSLAYSLLEDKGPIEGLWWGIVTGSTVGYGDFYPESTTGRAVASILIVSMLVLVPIAIGHVIAGLVLDRNQFTHEEQVALATTIEAMYDRVEMMERLLVAAMGKEHGEEWVREHLKMLSELEASDKDCADQMLKLFSDDEE
jgi:ion channel